MDKVLHSSESDEHYTPMWLLEMVVEVMGHIDLDPCADPSKRVPARKHYTMEDNGLTLPWRGKVFLNPPYGYSTGKWIKKLVRSVAQGWTTECVALVAARTDTQFFQPLHKQPVCYIEGRLRFSDYNYEEQDPAPFPSALSYFGANEQRFAEVFSRIGTVVKPMRVEYLSSR